MDYKKHRVLILAGGTGGHIFPALEVAKSLKSKGCYVHWIGTKAGLEFDLIPKAGFPISYISATGIRGKKWQKLLLTPIMLILSLLQSIYYVLLLKPNVVLGMGGYVSGPCGLAAFLLRKKLIIHEQNSIVGTTNKILSKIASKVLYAYPGAFKNIIQKEKGKSNNEKKLLRKYVLTGNPIRAQFNNIASPKQRLIGREKANSLKVLVLGGSRGALALNECMPYVVKNWSTTASKKLKIWHQTGDKLFEKTKEVYSKNNLLDSVKLEPFIDDMQLAYSFADVVICRAGALTISELAGCGVCSILIPLPGAIDDHQTTNALYLSENNAAIFLPQKELTPLKLITILLNFANNYKNLLQMAENAYKLGNTDALSKVVSYCLDDKVI